MGRFGVGRFSAQHLLETDAIKTDDFVVLKISICWLDHFLYPTGPNRNVVLRRDVKDVNVSVVEDRICRIGG
jgi:hypothetical protein